MRGRKKRGLRLRDIVGAIRPGACVIFILRKTGERVRVVVERIHRGGRPRIQQLYIVGQAGGERKSLGSGTRVEGWRE